MPQKLVFLFVPYHNTGGHFIHWSLGWLSGQEQYWSYQNKLSKFEHAIDIASKENFHHHDCDCIAGFNNVKEHSKLLLSQTEQSTHFVYITVGSFSDALVNLFNVKPGQGTVEQCKSAIEYINNDTKQMLHWIQSNQHPLIVFNYESSDLLNLLYNNRHPVVEGNKERATNEQVANQYEETFFDKTSERFTDNYIWDRREKLALILKEIEYYDYQTFIDRTYPHLYYTTDDVWNDFQRVIPEILKYLQLPLLSDRLDIWHNLYSAWRLKHDFSFSRHFNKIIDAIVHGYYMDLTRYNMNFYNEVLIQHALIKRHNLNLKTWQLEKLPTNTQEIHKLLEPNIHSI